MIEVERVRLHTLDDFRPLVGSVFQARVETGNVALVLVEATPLESPSAHPRAPFSLLFRGPLDRFLDQRTYALEPASRDVFEIFLVPVGRGPEGLLYEAVFN